MTASESVDNTENNEARNRIKQLFEYLVEYSRVKTPTRVHINQYEWQTPLASLPNHPSVVLNYASGDSEENEPFLKVARPKLTPCPRPANDLLPWLAIGWDKFEQAKPIHRESLNSLDENGETVVTFFEEEPDRVELWNAWTRLREAWRVAEAPAHSARDLFDKFFALRSTLEREGEKFALALGEGMLSWKSHTDGVIEHPLLLRRCSLAFDANKPEFSVFYEQSPTEFVTAILRESKEADLSGIPALLEQLRAVVLDPLSKDTGTFLAGVATRIWKDGELVDSREARADKRPSIFREPVLLLAPRGRDFAEAAQSFLLHLNDFPIPTSLMQVVGFEPPEKSSPTLSSQPKMPLLFTMSSNPEQERVAHRLNAHGSVLVQGPPGTGKTHTIANLIGHLLAQGKSILVTSHTSKALRVVRDKVVEDLRALCVSVLDDDRSSQKQLESAVKSIADHMTQGDKDTLAETAQRILKEKLRLEKLLAQKEQALLVAHRSEYEDLVVAGQGTAPAIAARKLAEAAGSHDWLPGPMEAGSSCPLDDNEIRQLYLLQAEVVSDDEQAVKSGLPRSEKLPNGNRFKEWCNQQDELARQGTEVGQQFWLHNNQELAAVEFAVRACMEIALPLLKSEPWMLECVQAGLIPAELAIWQELLQLIEDTASQIPALKSVIFRSRPALNLEWPLSRQISLCKETIERLKQKKSLKLAAFFNKELRQFLAAASVKEEPAQSVDDFAAILAHLELRRLRKELQDRWVVQLQPLEASPLPDHDPERTASELALSIRNCLFWHRSSWEPYHQRIKALGIDWEQVLSQVPAVASSHSKILRHKQALSGPLLECLEARWRQLIFHQIEKEREEALAHLVAYPGEPGETLRWSLQGRDPEAYDVAWRRLVMLEQLRNQVAKREELVKKLESRATGWAAAVRARRHPHQGPDVPGLAQNAWILRQWSQQLLERHQTDLDLLQRECSQLRGELQKMTARYVNALTWKFQAERNGVKQRQALLGWLQTRSQLGKGTGKTAAALKKSLREKLADCKSAVPVWIMPLNRVIEAYRPGETLFDVIIVDEASQADVTGLIAMTLGREIVVVGDHEQVSPSAVGERVEEAYELADKYLVGIPNRELFGGKSSVYDIAQRAFGETIRLREHFRCVPEIISFSNALCYDGDIQPLRESHDAIRPATISHRVAGGSRNAYLNENEAQAIATLIAACIEQPEYAEKTFGVISLVGDQQALHVEKLLRERLDARTLEDRRVLCGNPAQFQGDERDIMFLSVIDSPKAGPLRLTAHDNKPYRQRFNVAASRARDQMWVVHSLSLSNDLQAQDLRYLLLKHAEESANPESTIKRLKQASESVFEEQVLAALVKAGYRVEPQFAIGAYRIDLVVIGNDKRVAIECDGDRYHGSDKLEDDLKRQEILERVGGLPFIRIRGSSYFLDPVSAMQSVFRRLEELGVNKIGHAETQINAESELKNRVVRRAEELALEWWPPAPAPPICADAQLEPSVDLPPEPVVPEPVVQMRILTQTDFEMTGNGQQPTSTSIAPAQAMLEPATIEVATMPRQGVRPS